MSAPQYTSFSGPDIEGLLEQSSQLPLPTARGLDELPTKHTPEQLKAFWQRYLEIADERAEFLVNSLAEDESCYIKTGIIYHQTQELTRLPSFFDEATLKKLKDAFELSTPKQYKAYFAQQYEIVRLTNIIRKNTGKAGPIKDLVSRGNLVHTLLQRLNDISAQAKCDRMDLRRKAVELFIKDNELNAGHMNNNWILHLNETIRPGTEWEIFQRWVSAFPETQRMINAGRSLEAIAKTTLFQVADGHLESLIKDDLESVTTVSAGGTEGSEDDPEDSEDDPEDSKDDSDYTSDQASQASEEQAHFTIDDIPNGAFIWNGEILVGQVEENDDEEAPGPTFGDAA